MEIFKEQFDTRKLELYLNISTRGFILLQVNDRRYEKQLVQFISSMKETLAYNLQEIDFRDSVENFKISKNVQIVLYYSLHSHNGELRKILEKINLSRDLLAAKDKLIVFIVPQYVACMIQEDFPNLYSYFILKEIYITEYELLFDYILPGKKYLITKDAQREFKRFFYSSNEDLDVRLDYYKQKKAKVKDYNLLKKDFFEYLQKLAVQVEAYDRRYYYSLLLRMGDVCANQGDYEDASIIYDSILRSGPVASDFQDTYYKVWLHKSDIYLKQQKYDKAIQVYKDVLEMIARQHDYDMDNIFAEYIVKILPRIAICYAMFGEYEKADSYMSRAYEISHEIEDKEEMFAILYNRILLAIHMNKVQDNQIRPFFIDLENLISCDIQKAMYHLIYAWYRGVIGGHCRHALKYVKVALDINRASLAENDVRIAECHYLNSILFRLVDECEHSEQCRKKSINILKNHNVEAKISKIQNLF